MRKNEQETIKLFLIDLLEIEEKQCFQNNTEKDFYLTHKIPFYGCNFSFYNEPFYIIFQIDDHGIYFNDIEEFFGICKIEHNECHKTAEFFENLAPTVRVFKRTYENNAMESLFK